MEFFNKLKDTFNGHSGHKRIKNANPMVQFDKNGNVIRNTPKKTETSIELSNEQNIQFNEKLADTASIKQKIEKMEDSISKKNKALQKEKEATELAKQKEFEKNEKKLKKEAAKKEKLSAKEAEKQKKLEEKQKLDETYDVEEPYEFPQDIVKSIKALMNKMLDNITGKDAYGNEIKKNPEKKTKVTINRNNRFGKAMGSVYDFYFNTKEKYMALPKKIRLLTVSISFTVLLVIVIGIFQIWVSGFKDTNKTIRISGLAKTELSSLLDKKYPEKRSDFLKPLPYKTSPANLDVKAGAAILVDASNGCILYEKNADKPIPPASLTKLFVMYVVFQEIEKGKISMDDIVELPELSWAVNQPKDASLMNLGQGQKVTLRELMQGLAVASGNDAAKAVAYYVSGSPARFIERMNEECKKLGLVKTHFVEPSGYDENNMTTARELATFTRIYITKYPESLSDFHSLRYIDYPKKENLPEWQKKLGDSLAVHKVNTNPLLGLLDGVDGIKTGFIYESGYNLALTAKRENQRFLSITLQGRGKGTKAGNEGRIHDGTTMMEWAFNAFADYIPEEKHELLFPIPSLAAKENEGRFVNLIPAWTNAIPVPHLIGNAAKDSANSVKYSVELPNYLYGNVTKGETYGYITYKIGDITLEKVPLVADRDIEISGLWGRFWGSLAKIKLNKSE